MYPQSNDPLLAPLSGIIYTLGVPGKDIKGLSGHAVLVGPIAGSSAVEKQRLSCSQDAQTLQTLALTYR
jgi:hypothetical protein